MPSVGMAFVRVATMLVERSARGRHFVRAGFVMREMLKQVHALVHGSQQDQEHHRKRRHAAWHALSIARRAAR
jgi:hypothetical protein